MEKKREKRIKQTNKQPNHTCNHALLCMHRAIQREACKLHVATPIHVSIHCNSLYMHKQHKAWNTDEKDEKKDEKNKSKQANKHTTTPTRNSDTGATARCFAQLTRSQQSSYLKIRSKKNNSTMKRKKKSMINQLLLCNLIKCNLNYNKNNSLKINS